MVHRSPREFFAAFLAAVFFVLTVGRGDAQQPDLPLIPAGPPKLTPVPKAAEPAPAPKELSKEEIDSLIEKAFGKDCAELKQPIRVCIADVGMVFVAAKATVAFDGRSVRFESASAGVANGEAIVFRDKKIVVNVNDPVKAPRDLQNCSVNSVEVLDKDLTITLTAPKRHALAGAAIGSGVGALSGAP